MSTTVPEITFVMPAYNAAATITRCVASVQDQTVSQWRLIIVDDASTDTTASIAAQLADTDSRITVLNQPRNAGAGVARNRGIEAVQTQYLAFLDSDDTVEPDLVERVQAALVQTPVDVVVFGLTEEFIGAGSAIAGGRTLVPAAGLQRTADELHRVVLDLEEQTLFGYQWNRVYRTGLLREHQVRFEAAVLYEDYFFNLAVAEYATSQCCLDVALYHYVKGQATSITGSQHLPQYWELSQRRSATMLDAQRRWGLLDDTVRARLGVLYLRYLLSAVSRNAAPVAGLDRAAQRAWLADVASTPLFAELVPAAAPRSAPLRLFQQLVQRSRWGAAVVLASGTRRLRAGARPVYERLTRTERRTTLAAESTPSTPAQRVLVYGMTHNPGGIESYLMNRFRVLNHDELTFDFICDWPTMAYREEVERAGSQVHFIPAKGAHPLGHLLGWWRVLRAHRDYHTVYFNAMDAGVAVSSLVPKILGRRIVIHSHNSATDRGRFHRRFQPLLSRVVDDRYACAAGAADYLFGTRRDVGLVQNAIDLSCYRADSARREQVRQELDLAGRTVILSVGRFTAQKNSLRIPALLRAVVDENPKAVLLWVGQGELEAEARDEVNALGLRDHVRFLGIRDDVADLMQAADVFLLPSRFEGLAFVLVEAQAAGLGCVVSTAVARESCVGGVRFVDLAESDQTWARELLAVAGQPRGDYQEVLAEQGFDVHRPNADTRRLLDSLAGRTR
ncbi:MAG: glycosyltransferase [Propionibacteriaceae bacterium]